MREILQRRQFDLREQRVRRQFRRVPSQQSHQRQPPGDHRVDRHRPLDPLPLPVPQVLHPAARLQHPVPDLDAPEQAVVAAMRGGRTGTAQGELWSGDDLVDGGDCVIGRVVFD